MPRLPSRPKRWAAACAAASDALDKLDEALLELADLKEEYEEWRDNLPDNLQSSALYDKLEEVINLDIDADSASDLRSAIDEAEAVELPRGFGRD